MTIYIKFNPYRSLKFRLITTIENDKGNLISTKSINEISAADFLSSFAEKYSYLLKNKFPINPVAPKMMAGNKISFKFIGGMSYESRIVEAFTKSSKIEVLELFKEYINHIYSIPSKRTSLPLEFVQMFGGEGKKVFDCMKVGCLDLNLDNIIVSGTNNYLIDYEWTFNFPIPKKYILFRAFFNFYYKNQYLHLDKIIKLGELFQITKISEDEKDLFCNYEAKFQGFVSDRFVCPDKFRLLLRSVEN